MARGIRAAVAPKITELPTNQMPEDSGVAVYRDKAGSSRMTVITEGGSNLASMVAQHAEDEARRLAKEQADASEETI